MWFGVKLVLMLLGHFLLMLWRVGYNLYVVILVAVKVMEILSCSLSKKSLKDKPHERIDSSAWLCVLLDTFVMLLCTFVVFF